MKEIEVQNKIHPRNIAAFFIIGIIGIINGMMDFFTYQIPLSKILVPDPVAYQQIVVMNQTMLQSINIQNSIGMSTSLGILIVIVFSAVVIIGLTSGAMMRCD